MIFYTNTPGLVVNSKKANRIIARFDKDGKFETHNPAIIAKMREHFRNDGIDFKSLSYWDLKKMAEKKGIETHKIKREALIKVLEEGER
ncbi:unnamed protein product [marine sediment metagenome]|uniref:Uncharacterized protein n=1 Tax=marine sediment metagenome TaxID=412755 RepID=X1SLW9_9ZZZZ